MADRLEFPDGKRFAFTILDDTDVATTANVMPIYRLLESLGMRTTKTVWPVGCPEGSPNFSTSDTLEDAEYRAFVVDLQRRGFEIASHGATMESSPRERTLAALARFRELFGADPKVHANHSYNRENVYWGLARIDDPILRLMYRRTNGRPPGWYEGDRPGSPWWWGDVCAERISYVRNLTFDTLNLATINPSMPYHDPKRPLVRWWFSSTDAESVTEFNRLLEPARVSALEREGGYCIVATHLGKGFVQGGEVHPLTRQRLEALASRPGWFCTTGELLDFLRERRTGSGLPSAEWRRMQWRWATDLMTRRIAGRWRRKTA